MRTLHMNRIEDFAFAYLKNYYKQQYNAEDVFVFIDEKAKNGATADGLFSFYKTETDPLFIATLHTEFSDRISDLLINYKKKKFKTLIFAFTILATALTAFSGYLLSGNMVVTALLLTLFPVIYFCSMLVYWSFCKRQLLNIVNKLRRLPANQKWLGLSISSQVFKRNKLGDTFLAICKEKGAGVITVGKRSKVILMQEPKDYNRRNGDFLSYYRSEISIRKEILGDRIMRVA